MLLVSVVLGTSRVLSLLVFLDLSFTLSLGIGLAFGFRFEGRRLSSSSSSSDVSSIMSLELFPLILLFSRRPELGATALGVVTEI